MSTLMFNELIIHFRITSVNNNIVIAIMNNSIFWSFASGQEKFFWFSKDFPPTPLSTI